MPSPSPIRVLIVEESPELAQLVAAAATERLRVEVAVCRGGEEALRHLHLIHPSAAVVALPLADVRAGELLGALRRAGVAAVAVSGVYRGARSARQVAELGAAAFFEKPFAVEALMATLGRLLGIGAARPPPGDDPDPGPDLPGEESGRRPPPAAPAVPSPQGDVSRTRVPLLLAALHTAQATGMLALERGPAKRIVLLERGVPVYACSNLASERFGTFCVRRGLITEAERQALAREIGPQGRTGAALLERGRLTEALRAEILAEQVKAIVWSTFPWRDGSYRIALQPLPRREIVPLGLAPGDFILEGVLRTADPATLREELPDSLALAPRVDAAFELYELGLRPAEARLLALADGTKTVADLVALTDLPATETRAFLWFCRLVGVLDQVERVLASTRRIAFT